MAFRLKLAVDSSALNRKLSSWDFDVWDYTFDELLVITMRIFKNLGVLKLFNINIGLSYARITFRRGEDLPS